MGAHRGGEQRTDARVLLVSSLVAIVAILALLGYLYGLGAFALAGVLVLSVVIFAVSLDHLWSPS